MPRLCPLSDALGTEVSGLDLHGEIPAAIFDRLFRAWIDTTVLLFREQSLTPTQQIAFTRRFGELLAYTRAENALPKHPEVLVLSNLTRDGKLIGSPASGRYWHTDGHYLREPPSASLLYAIEVPPEGGNTLFANMFAVWSALSDEDKARIDGRKVVISRVQSRPYNYPNRPPVTDEQRAAWPDMSQPLVRVHPISGRKALYIGGNVPWRIEGMPVEESAPLITRLQAYATGPKFVYEHKWRPGDVILWDNRSSMHRASWYDEQTHRRLLHRTTVAGDPPF